MKRVNVESMDGRQASFEADRVVTERAQYRLDVAPGSVLLVPMVNVRTVLVEELAEKP